MTDLDTEKSELRKAAQKRRKQAHDDAPDAGAALAHHVSGSAPALGFKDGLRVVSSYWPMGTEIDVRPLMRALAELGHTIALPVVTAPATPLTFRQWQDGDVLIDGGFGTSIPSDAAPSLMPDILIVPMLAFDTAGYRLGYGGGFYDRTLQKLRDAPADQAPFAVGAAFAGQRLDRTPRGPHDQRLDAIATELGTLMTSESGQELPSV